MIVQFSSVFFTLMYYITSSVTFSFIFGNTGSFTLNITPFPSPILTLIQMLPFLQTPSHQSHSPRLVRVISWCILIECSSAASTARRQAPSWR
jgi:hypothetical protein